MNKNTQELLYQALETELGGEQVYMAAIRCAQNSELKEEWQKYLEETQNHQRIVLQVFDKLGLDANGRDPRPGRRPPHRRVAGAGDGDGPEERAAARPRELVAAECVVLAETKDHANWELIGKVAESLKGEEAKPSRRHSKRSRSRRTCTSTTPWAGPANCGFSSSECRPSCRRRKRRRRSRPPSAPPAPSSHAAIPSSRAT